MPIQLATQHVYSPGHGDPDVTSDFVEVVRMDVDTIEDQMLLTVQYGNRDADNNWVPSGVPNRVIRIRNKPADTRAGTNDTGGTMVIDGVEIPPGAYVEMEVTPADPRFKTLVEEAVTQYPTGTKIFLETQIALYTWLLTHGHEDGSVPVYYSGTIVP